MKTSSPSRLDGSLLDAGDGTGVGDCSVGVAVGIGVSEGKIVGKAVFVGDGATMPLSLTVSIGLVAVNAMIGSSLLASLAGSAFSLLILELAITAPVAASKTVHSNAKVTKIVVFLRVRLDDLSSPTLDLVIVAENSVHVGRGQAHLPNFGRYLRIGNLPPLRCF